MMEVSHRKLKDGSEDEYEDVFEVETLNDMVPIWKRNKNKVTEDEYNTFYSDKFFDYGFAEMVSDILAKYKDKPEVSKCFFSATLLQSLGEIITTQFFDAISISIGLANIPARHIDQEFIYCTNEDGKLIGIRNIFRGKLEFPILIFVEGIKKLKAIYECVKFEIPKISSVIPNPTKNL